MDYLGYLVTIIFTGAMHVVVSDEHRPLEHPTDAFGIASVGSVGVTPRRTVCSKSDRGEST